MTMIQMHARASSLLATLVGRLWCALAFVGRLVAFLYPRQMKPTSSRAMLHPTAYLDSLRGYAALVVVNGHVLFSGPSDQYPWLRIFFNGPWQVATFYVISGFVLSYSGLKNVHKGQPEKVSSSLASSVFRRWFRLYTPVAFATFVAMLAFASGLASGGPTQPTFLGNLWFWALDTKRFTNPYHAITPAWDIGMGSRYAIQTWTIGLEFRGSMVVFLFLAGVCKMKPWIRTVSLLGSAILAFACWSQGDVALFLFGMWLADLRLWGERGQPSHSVLPRNISDRSVYVDTPNDIIVRQDGFQDDPTKSSVDASLVANDDQESQQIQPGGALQETVMFKMEQDHTEGPMGKLLRRFSYTSLRRELPCFALLAVYLYCHATPPPSDEYLRYLFDQLWVYCACILCFALERSSILKKPLETPFSLWLGELSFGIYVMHYTIKFVLWDRYLIPWQITYIGTETFSKFLPGYFVLLIAIFWAAEVFRWVDIKCVRFSKTLADYAFE